MAIDCNKFDNFEKPACQKRRLKENCAKFDGKMEKGKCSVSGYPMARADFLFEHKKPSQSFRKMSPQEFLDSVPPEPFRNPDTLKDLRQKIRKGELDPLFLDVDVDTCKVLGHEGRNRALASKQEGLSEVPVVIFKKEFEPEAKDFLGNKTGVHLFTDKEIKCKKLKRQNS